MLINNNINSMMQLEKRLEDSAKALSKLSLNNEEMQNEGQQKDVKEQLHTKIEEPIEVSLSNEMISQIEIPIAYTANAEVISAHNTIYETLLDIKA